MTWRQLTVLAAVVGIAAPATHAGQDILIADFEGEDYGDWEATGGAFGPGPARGTLPNQMRVSGFVGKGLVNSYHGGDGTTGTLTSPPFTIERRRIHFLVGGGKYPGETCINLVVDGDVVRTATGPNDRPGGSERLDWHVWDVAELAGKKAVIQIVDQRTGGWGHINVDHILQSDDPTKETRMEIRVEKRYLNLPVKSGASMRRVRLTLGKEVVREFEMELAEAEPDFWVFVDLTPFRGQTLTLWADGLLGESQALRAIAQDDAIKGAERLYAEKHRPQFHFSSRRGWNNDPNGLVYHKGEYHLFYQHNPYGWKWGNMHWGHAVSTDLVHWRELPIALYPHRFGDWCFSGSAVVDHRNTAGFKTGDEDVIVAAYTSTGRGESIAYSNDRGRTFTDYDGNPVVKHRGRDPKVIWYEPGGHWVMAVYDERDGSRGIAFYSSPDLKDWQYQSRIEGYYECPELFELPVDGDENNRKWVVYAADGDYALGSFDGKTFITESGKHRFNYGNCFYASQTFNNVPPEDGRRIQMAWGRVNMPDMPFNQMMLFPVELTLRTTDEGERLFARPVREIELLHGRMYEWENVALEEGSQNPLAEVSGELLHIRAEFQVGQAAQFGLAARGSTVAYDVGKQELTCAGKKAPLKPVEGKIRLEILVDRASVEVFANDGRVYMPIGAIPPDDDRALGVFTVGGPTEVSSLEVYELRSAWVDQR
ncbi:MAG: GH32 C-terminal domain-containing protein [Armatimonadota bacterium]